MRIKRITVLLVAVLMVVALAGCSGSKVGTAPDGNELAIEKATIKFYNDAQAGGYKIVATEELQGWISENKDMVIIDTMPASSYNNGHIPGAVNAELPMAISDVTAELRAAFIETLGTDKNKTIVTYCGFVNCARSHVGAVIALEEGYTNVYRLPGGIVAWKDAKFDVEK